MDRHGHQHDVGYVLDPSYDMPPLMLTPNEIEAAVLGAQWVAERGDPGLARGARDLMAKIRDVVPEHLRPMILQAAVVAPCLIPLDPDPLELEALRAAVRDQRRHFRTDRIESVEFLAERYPRSARRLHAAWRAEVDGRPLEAKPAS